MLWKLFGSEQAVQQALDQSVGYDISLGKIQMPANTDKPKTPAKTAAPAHTIDKITGKADLKFIAPWEEKKA